MIGLDLGQSQDPTAIVVLHHRREPLDSWKVNETDLTTRQDIRERFDCVVAERLKLGMSYPEIVSYVREVLARPPLKYGCYLVIDESGVGRPVGDMYDAAGLKPVRVTITAGNNAEKKDGRRWNVAKSLLISGVDARLHAGELRFAAELGEAHALAEELKDFRRHVTSAGRQSFQARLGKHDDLVLSVSLAVWWCTMRRKFWASVGPLRGLI